MSLVDIGRMSETEFRSWQQYDRRTGLPIRRLELYLAQVAHTVALSSGRYDSPPKLRDFLIPDEPDEAEVADLEALKAEIGFTPRKKRSG